MRNLVIIQVLLIGLAALYKEHSKEQKIHLLKTNSDTGATTETNQPKQLQLNTYFVRDTHEQIKRKRKSYSILELNICSQDSEIFKKIPRTWKAVPLQKPSNTFSCSGVAKTYRVTSRFFRVLKRILDTAAFTLDHSNDLTCVDELKMRKLLIQQFRSKRRSYQWGSKIIRMTFHDSIDHQNLMSAEKLDGTVDEQAPSGVDFCLHTSLLENKQRRTGDNDILDEDPNGQGRHNRGLVKAKKLVQRLAFKYPQFDPADIMVIGTVVAIGQLFQGEQVPLKLGRKAGDCDMIFCAGKNCKGTQDYFLIHEPNQNSRDPKHNIQFFKNLGFTLEEGVALMGAHSVGGVNVCTGTGNPGDYAWCQTAPKVANHRLNRRQTYFDSTPEKLDNQYFKELTQNYSDNIPSCKSLRKHKEIRNRKGNLIAEAQQQDKFCEVKVCDAGRKIRYTGLESKGFNSVEQRKVAYLPCDWAMQKNQETKNIESQYGQDQSKFQSNFVSAFEKVINKGYDDNQLYTCKSVDCTLKGDTFECDKMKFKAGVDDCNPSGEVDECKLIGAYRIKGVIKCGEKGPFKCEMTP